MLYIIKNKYSIEKFYIWLVTLILQVQKLIKELAEKENIPEELKSNNQMLWIDKINNIKNIAEEIILKEYIYV